MKRIYKYIGIVIIVFSLYFFLKYLIENISSLPSINWTPKVIVISILSLFIYSITNIVGSLGWAVLLKAVGEKIKLKEAFILFNISQFAKYIPGNIGQHIGRIALAQKYKLKLHNVILTMVLEVVALVITGGMLSIIFLPVLSKDYLQEIPYMPPLWVFFLIAVGIIGLPLLLVNFLNSRYRPKFLVKKIGDQKIRLPKLISFIKCTILFSLSFLAMGLLSQIIVRYFFEIDGNFFFLLTGVYTVSWIAGYLIPGAPAGMGIREVISVSALSLIFNPGVSLGITIFVRFISILGDAMIFFFALFWRSFSVEK